MMWYVLNGPVILIICIIGSILNISAIYVLASKVFPRQNSTRHYSTHSKTNLKAIRSDPSYISIPPGSPTAPKKIIRSRIFIYLLWLTGCDAFLLICSIFNFSIPILINDDGNDYMQSMPIWYAVANAASTANVWLMVALVLDRYWSLARTFKNAVFVRHDQRQRIHAILTFLCIMACVYSSPRFFEIKITYYSGYGVYLISYTSLKRNQYYMLFYRIIGSCVFYSTLPYIVVFFAFFRCCYVLRKSEKIRELLNVSKQQNSTTKQESNRLLIVLSIRFLLSRLPTTLLDIYEMIVGSDEFFQSSIAMFLVYVSNFLVISASASTFFIFLFFSCKFRAYMKCIVKKLFICKENENK